jgi:hypothetical protein
MKITRTIFITLSVILFFQRLNGAEYDMTEVNQKIKAITEKKLHLLEVSALDEQALFSSQEFLSLQVKCNIEWVNIISNLDKIDGGDEAKKLAIYGLGQLPAQNYMTAIESLVTKYENGLLTEKLLEIVLSPMGRMGYFVTDNFNHPRIIAALNRIKVKSTNVALKNELNNILSGSDKLMRDNFREAHAGFAEGNTPIVILPP